jgi:hypothetical protein
LSSNAAQTSPQNAFLEFQAPFTKPGEAPAKPTRSLRGPISCYHPLASASEAQTSPSFPPAAETWYLVLARQEPSRNQFAKAEVFREAARSQPLHKSMPCVAISEAPASVYRPLATKKNTAHVGTGSIRKVSKKQSEIDHSELGHDQHCCHG